MLGLGPVWMSENEDAKQLVGKLPESGSIFDSGLGEGTWRRHLLHRHDPHADGGRLGRQRGKYYIGNGNVAGRLSVFGKFADTDEHAFFLVDTQAPQYEPKKNVVESQMFVAAFDLHDYPVTKADIPAHRQARDAALATVNVGKVNLGWASIGICEHAFTRLSPTLTIACSTAAR